VEHEVQEDHSRVYISLPGQQLFVHLMGRMTDAWERMDDISWYNVEVILLANIQNHKLKT
jgi:hypothetical protein